MLSIYLDEDNIFQTGVKYALPKTGINNFRRGNYANLALNRKTDFGFLTYSHKAKDGWIIFTDYQDHYTQKENNKETTYKGHYLFGKFEFTAVDKTNDRTIKISDGKFENLKAL